MLDVPALAVFVPAAVALILTPGPDTLYVLSRGVGAGRRVGVRAALGVSTGVLVHTLAAVLGLSVLLRTSAVAYAAVRYVGAAYLCYLGVAAIRNRGTGEMAGSDGENGGDPRPAGAGRGGYVRGVLVNVLNPKVALFFLAFLPQFVPAGANAPTTMALLGGVYSVLTLAYLGGVALFSGAIGRALDGYGAAVEAVAGLVLVAFGAGLAVDGAVGTVGS